MTKLPDQILTRIFLLQRQLIERLDEAAAVEAMIMELFGETEATIPELDELVNIKERLIDPYSRLSALLLRTAQAQPNASSDMLELLYRTIERAEAAADASLANVQEIKRNWNLL